MLYYGMVSGVNSNIGLQSSRVALAGAVSHEAAVRDVRVNAGASSADSRALEHGQQRPEDGAECRVYSDQSHRLLALGPPLPAIASNSSCLPSIPSSCTAAPVCSLGARSYWKRSPLDYKLYSLPRLSESSHLSLLSHCDPKNSCSEPRDMANDSNAKDEDVVEMKKALATGSASSQSGSASASM